MGSLENLKDRSTYYAINKIIGLLSKASVDKFIDLTYWGEKLTVDPEVKDSIGHIRGFLTDTAHPSAEEIYTFRSKYMDRYAEKYGELADRVWEEEYMNMRDAIEGGPGGYEMKCDQCGQEISEGDSYTHLGETLCEDCYLDARLEVKACDPWAVHSATRFRESSGIK